MSDIVAKPKTGPNAKAAQMQRFREGLVLHEIEGNPLTPDEIAMFEMFHREGWTHEQRRAYMAKLAHTPAK
jgi:hypothetical protein